MGLPVLMYLVVCGVAATNCLLAIWTAGGRAHWFARTCAMLAALALLVPVRAHEPLVLFAMTAVLLAFGFQVARWWRLSPAIEGAACAGRYRFGLADLLLTCVVAAAASWLVSALVAAGVTISWWRFGLAAAMLAILSSLAVAVVGLPRRWLSLPLLATAILVAPVVDRFVLGNWLAADEVLSILRDQIFSDHLGLDRLTWLYGGCALWTLALAIGVGAWRQNYRLGWVRYATRAALILAAAPFLALVGAVYWHMLGEPQVPAVDVGRENVLPQVVALAEQLPSATPHRARAICEEILPLLQRPGAIVIDWPNLGRDGKDFQIAFGDIHTIRDLARRLSARSDSLRNAGKHDKAADYSQAIVRLGAMVNTDGILVHRLVGEAILGIGHQSLARCRTGLSRDKTAEAGRLVEADLAGREPIEITSQRDAAWSVFALTWRHRLENAVNFQIWGQTPDTGMTDWLRSIQDRDRCKSELLAIDLALRAYRADRGAWPQELSELAPTYLKQIPLDHFSGRPLIYRPDEPSFVLYSVGTDGQDNGGKFTDYQTYQANPAGHDFDVDTLTRP